MRVPTAPSPIDLSRMRRRVLAVCGGLIIAGSLVDQVMILGAFDPLALSARLVWGGYFLWMAWRLRHGGERLLRSLGIGAALVTSAMFAVIIWRTGGASSPLFAWHVALPLAFTAIGHDEVPAVLIAFVGTTLSALGMLLGAGAASSDILIWMAAQAFAGAFAILGSTLFRGFRRSERAQYLARLHVVEQLSRSERQRADAERLALIGRLAAGVAHEINNPLAWVTSNVSALREASTSSQAFAPAELEELHEETAEGLRRIGQIVADMKLLAREGKTEPEALRVASAVEEAVRMASFRLRGRAEVTVEVDPSLPEVLADRRRLVQVLLNLLVNAVEALEEAGVDRPAIWIRARPANGGLELTVEDNGPGLPPAVLARLFEPFFTTKPPGKGTGLGLSLSREYVESFGGRIGAENRPEGGARFTISLRRGREQAGAVDNPGITPATTR